MLELTTINTMELTNKKLGTQLNAEDEVEQESNEVDESTESSTSNTNDDALAPIKNLIDTMTRDELLAVKEYIEKRL